MSPSARAKTTIEEEEEVVEEEDPEEEEVDPEEEVEEEVVEEKVEEEKVEEEVVEEKVEEEKVEEEVVEEKVEEEAEKGGAPRLLQSVNHLQSLHGVLSEFLLQWDGLQHTLDSIQASIDARTKELDALYNPPPDVAAKEEGQAKAKAKAKATEEPSSNGPRDPRSELHFICETMGSRDLRRYITKHLAEIGRLRKEVPTALRRAPNPAKLVLESLGRFYLQGRKAYNTPDSPMVTGRRACILLLEFYILSGGCSSQVEPLTGVDARTAAAAWRGRLISEGGIKLASAVDALGLLLFIASFGIPPEFSCRDLYDLLRSSNLQKKTNVLRLSPILLDKLPDIIKDMIAKDMHLEAVDLVCAFGLEEKFPPLPLLSSFCHKSLQIAKEERREGQCSLRSLKEANEKELGILKAVVKCLEGHKLDPSLLAGFSIFEKIAELEEEMSKGEGKLQNRNLKRMGEEVGPLKTQAKRPWSAYSETSSHGIPPKQTQEQGSGVPCDSRGLYNGYFPLDGAAGNVHGPSPTAGQNLYQPAVGGESSGCNLYRFAETVLQHESYYSHSSTNPGGYSS